MSEVVQNGNHFKLTITTGSKVIQNEFTLGEECELETMTGEKVKVGDAPSYPSHTLLLELFLELGPRASSLEGHTSHSHHGCPISEFTSGVRSRKTTSAPREEALWENFPKD